MDIESYKFEKFLREESPREVGDEVDAIDLEKLVETPMRSPLKWLWVMVICLAVNDGATEVRYEPWRKKGVLRCTVQGKQYETVPPPSGMATEMINSLYQLSIPESKSTWSTRFARWLRGWADYLDRPIHRDSMDFQIKLTSGQQIAIRSNTPSNLGQRVGVVLRFVPATKTDEEASAIRQRWENRAELSDSNL